MLIGAGIIFLLMMMLFAAVIIAPRRFKSIPTRYWQIGGGILFPLPILMALTFLSFLQGENQIADKHEEGTLQISAEAMMWSWEFTYHLPNGEVKTTNLLHIPTGQPVQINTTSRDVIHGFWVPKLGGKVDAIPGQMTSIVLEADREGRFGGLCAEYCGSEHTSMTFDVEAHSPNDFAAKMLELGNKND